MKFTLMIQLTNLIFATNQRFIFKDFKTFMDRNFIDPFQKFQVEERSASNDQKQKALFFPDLRIISRISHEASGFHEDPRSSISYGFKLKK